VNVEAIMQAATQAAMQALSHITLATSGVTLERSGSGQPPALMALRPASSAPAVAVQGCATSTTQGAGAAPGEPASMPRGMVPAAAGTESDATRAEGTVVNTPAVAPIATEGEATGGVAGGGSDMAQRQGSGVHQVGDCEPVVYNDCQLGCTGHVHQHAVAASYIGGTRPLTCCISALPWLPGCAQSCWLGASGAMLAQRPVLHAPVLLCSTLLCSVRHRLGPCSLQPRLHFPHQLIGERHTTIHDASLLIQEVPVSLPTDFLYHPAGMQRLQLPLKALHSSRQPVLRLSRALPAIK
jgi:hypothetical protein